MIKKKEHEKTILVLDSLLTNSKDSLTKAVREYVRVAIFEFGEGEDEWGILVDAEPEQIHISDIDFKNEDISVFSEASCERYAIPLHELMGFLKSGCSVEFFYDLKEKKQQKARQTEIEDLKAAIEEEQQCIKECEKNIKDWIIRLSKMDKGDI